MGVGQRIVKNTLVLFSSQIITKLINLLLVLILTRMLGARGFGIYSFAFAFVALFMVLANLGINSLLTRDIAREKSRINRFLGSSIPLLLFLSAAVFLLINFLAFFLTWEPSVILAIRIFSLYLIFDNFSRHFIAVFRAFEKMEFEAFTNLVERVAMLLAGLILWKMHRGLISLLWCFVAIEFLKALTAFLFMRRFFDKIEWRWYSPETAKILKQAIPFALMIIFGTVSSRIDTVMIKIFHGEQLVAYYNVARKIVESLTFIPENVVMALFPALSALFLADRDNFCRTFSGSLQFLLFLALPIATALFLLARPTLALLFPPEYLAGTVALQWLSVALGLIFVKYHLMVTLNAIGQQQKFAIIAGASMLLNVVLNYLLIPDYRLLGAALATVASEALAVGLSVLALQKAGVSLFIFSKLLRILAATFLMGISIRLLQPAGYLWQIAGGGVAYLLFAWMMGVVNAKEWHVIRSALRGRLGGRNDP